MSSLATSISLPEFNSSKLGTKPKFKPKFCLENQPDPEENLEFQPLILESKFGPSFDFKPKDKFGPKSKPGTDILKPLTHISNSERKPVLKSYLRPELKPEPDIEANQELQPVPDPRLEIRSEIQAESRPEPVPRWPRNGHRSKPRYEPKPDIVVNQATPSGLIQSTSFCPDCPTCMGVTLGYHQQGGPMGLSYAFLWNIKVQTSYNLKSVDLICPNCMQHVRTRIEKRTLAWVWLLGMMLLTFW